jgi:hypothetical protein
VSAPENKCRVCGKPDLTIEELSVMTCFACSQNELEEARKRLAAEERRVSIELTREEHAALERIQERLNNQDAALTHNPAYVVYFGDGPDDPQKRINVICITQADAEWIVEKTKHQGKQFIFVHSFARGRDGAFLLDWLKDEVEFKEVRS